MRKPPYFPDSKPNPCKGCGTLIDNTHRYPSRHQIFCSSECYQKWKHTDGRNITRLRHGNARPGQETSEYNSWRSMHERCRNPKCDNYADYGGRGIQVCERWKLFENFLTDMGRRPTPQHTLDRYPDVNGNYKPGNCRWATPKEQRANQRLNIAPAKPCAVCGQTFQPYFRGDWYRYCSGRCMRMAFRDRKRGGPPRYRARPHLTAEERQGIRALRQTGLTYREIGKRFQTCESNIRWVLKSLK